MIEGRGGEEMRNGAGGGKGIGKAGSLGTWGGDWSGMDEWGPSGVRYACDTHPVVRMALALDM